MRRNILSSFFILFSFSVFSQDQLVTAPKYQRHDVYAAPEVHENANLILDLPFLDLPYIQYAAKTTGKTDQPSFSNYLNSYANPGMNVSLGLSYSSYATLHYGIKRIVTIDNKFWHNVIVGLGVGAVDLGLRYAPLGSNWLHNEFTKSVMSKNFINGQNEMYHFSNGLAHVTHVTDADLASLKAKNNPDFVRMQVAGMEGEYLLIDKLQRTNFFYRSNLPNLILYWFTTLKNVNAINEQTDITAGNNLINKEVNFAGNDPSKIDYTGLEYTSWAHNLFNPSEKFTHRYNSPENFTKEAIAYMRTQANLHYINAISPLMFGIKGIVVKKDEIGNSWRLNFTGRHLFTSFGNDVSAKFYFQTPKNNWVFTLHHYNNLKNSFQGLETELLDVIIKTANKDIEMSFKTMVWRQPKNNDFYTSSAQAGGLLGVKFQYPLTKILRPYLEVEGKTAGWVAGHIFLGSNVNVRLGVNAVFGGQ